MSKNDETMTNSPVVYGWGKNIEKNRGRTFTSFWNDELFWTQGRAPAELKKITEHKTVHHW
jgi:hypothetical protein